MITERLIRQLLDNVVQTRPGFNAALNAIRAALEPCGDAVAWLAKWTESGTNCSRSFVDHDTALRCVFNLTAYSKGVADCEVLPLYAGASQPPALGHFKVLGICDAYESGYGFGLNHQDDGPNMHNPYAQGTPEYEAHAIGESKGRDSERAAQPPPVDCRAAGLGRGRCDMCAAGHYEKCRYVHPTQPSGPDADGVTKMRHEIYMCGHTNEELKPLDDLMERCSRLQRENDQLRADDASMRRSLAEAPSTTKALCDRIENIFCVAIDTKVAAEDRIRQIQGLSQGFMQIPQCPHCKQRHAEPQCPPAVDVARLNRDLCVSEGHALGIPIRECLRCHAQFPHASAPLCGTVEQIAITIYEGCRDGGIDEAFGSPTDDTWDGLPEHHQALYVTIARRLTGVGQ